jgi:hypothetical protein
MILLTSFNRAAEHEAEWPGAYIWSSAVRQPDWLPQRPKAEWMDIRPTPRAKWTRPRLFLDHPSDPLVGYFDALMDLYESRLSDVERWVETTADHEHTWVCCWCPYDTAAKRQIEEWGTFVCHTAAVGLVLERMGLPVVYDKDRGRMERADGYTSR